MTIERIEQAMIENGLLPKNYNQRKWCTAFQLLEEAQKRIEADAAQRLKEHFTPGNVVFLDYWKSYDLVVGFSARTSERDWEVLVIECDETGTKLLGDLRSHCTYPDFTTQLGMKHTRDYVVTTGVPVPELRNFPERFKQQ